VISFRHDSIIHSCKVLTIPLVRCDAEIFSGIIKLRNFNGIDRINDGKLLQKR